MSDKTPATGTRGSKLTLCYRNGWGASAIDALSTAIVMEDAAVIGQIVDYIPTIDFDKSSNSGDTISLFETTIRYLGGLLSGV